MQAPAVQPGRFLFAQDRPPRAANRPRALQANALPARTVGGGAQRVTPSHAATAPQSTASPPGERITSHQAHRRRLAPSRAPPAQAGPPRRARGGAGSVGARRHALPALTRVSGELLSLRHSGVSLVV